MSKCFSCYFYDPSVGCCDYYLATGHRRECPGGNACTKYEARDGRTRRQQEIYIPRKFSVRTFKEDAYAEMYRARHARWQKGMTDKQIAEAEGKSVSAIKSWRKRQRLRANKAVKT